MSPVGMMPIVLLDVLEREHHEDRESDQRQRDADPHRPGAATDQRAERVGEQRRTEHGQHEPTGVDDPAERERRDHAERGERERR